MDWGRLLSAKRLGNPDATPANDRSPFQQDLDRIVYSTAFRALQDKTQVHPLPESDRVRSRLTHSLEASSVGRSLGTLVGQGLSERHPGQFIVPHEIGYLVQAACLAHDIGNPPFGHSGEKAIQRWFKCDDQKNLIEPAKKSDFEKFDGNAQGFRILTSLESSRRGGLQLTYATLGTFSKYPRSSRSAHKKFGFFESEREIFEELATNLGLRKIDPGIEWARHPFAYLVEAADDICYSIVDIEDGFELGVVSYADAAKYLQIVAGTQFPKGKNNSEKIKTLRAKAIEALVRQLSAAFLDNEVDLVAGVFDKELKDETTLGDAVSEAIDFARKNIYGTNRNLEIEIASFDVMDGLLNAFSDLALSLEDEDWRVEELSGKEAKLNTYVKGRFSSANDRYSAFLSVTDLVSGLTDRGALKMYRKLKGISV